MSETKIVQAGHPVLRRTASLVPATAIGTQEFRELIDTMVETMRAAPGVGLAAPQIGVPLAVVVLEDDEKLMSRLSDEERAARERVPFPLRILVNPVLTIRDEGAATFFEGCLSVDGYVALVERHTVVEVTALDERGAEVQWVARGWPARILQHELDHLAGTLYVDRMITRSFCANAEALARWIHRPTTEVREGLGA